MSLKTTKILYWTLTILFSAFMLMAGITEMIQHESGKEIMRHLGYPMHVLTVLGIGKTLGAIALVQNKFKTIKEWAFAGFTFNFLGAFVARWDAGDSTGLIISPFIFLTVLFIIYFLWKRMEVKRSYQV